MGAHAGVQYSGPILEQILSANKANTGGPILDASPGGEDQGAILWADTGANTGGRDLEPILSANILSKDIAGDNAGASGGSPRLFGFQNT